MSDPKIYSLLGMHVKNKITTKQIKNKLSEMNLDIYKYNQSILYLLKDNKEVQVKNVTKENQIKPQSKKNIIKVNEMIDHEFIKYAFERYHMQGASKPHIGINSDFLCTIKNFPFFSDRMGILNNRDIQTYTSVICEINGLDKSVDNEIIEYINDNLEKLLNTNLKFKTNFK
ncbi:hypothetical protein A0H76_1462 [Hepatospora eriocheir]|uniref:Uncharacterized protein n=1 Tax=Hepatospora eriocheir TaxID=1081669 RepID=A0A1X0QKV4_9MICR|nr:hypothetical protein A0H76_1462 [Hepatospora eriocheir]